MGLENNQPIIDVPAEYEVAEQLINPANGMTVIRVLASLPTGYYAAKGHDLAGPAMILASATDMEGNVARWGARHGRGWLTEWGRKFDTVADKVLAVSVATGTLIGGLGSTGETALTSSILAEQVAVAGIAIVAEKRNPGELQVPKIGKVGICLVFGYLAGKNLININAIEQNAGVHDVISAATNSLGFASLGVVALAAKGYIKSAFGFVRKPSALDPAIPELVPEPEIP